MKYLFQQKLIKKYIAIVEIFDNQATSVKHILPPFFANLKLEMII